MEDRCITCGDIIPEGIQVCNNCMKGKTSMNYIANERINQLEEVQKFLEDLYHKEENRIKRNTLYNHIMSIKASIGYIKAQEGALEANTATIDKLRKENNALQLGEYWDKLKTQQNNLLSNIQGYLEDLKS